MNARSTIYALIVFAATSLLYWQTTSFEFIWDDFGVIVHNQNIRSLKSAFGTFLSREDSFNSQYDPSRMTAHNYRPLRTIIHAIAFRLVGLNPFYFHLLNTLGHAITSVMAYVLLTRLFSNRTAALLGALLWAVHPLNTEVVCWSKQLEDTMAAFLLFTSFYLFLVRFPMNKTEGEYDNTTPRIPRWLITLACLTTFALSLLSKLSTAFFPVFLLIFTYASQLKTKPVFTKNSIKSIDIQRLTGIGGMFLLVLMVSGLRRHMVGNIGQGGYLTGNCWTTWLSLPRLLLRYLRLEIIPVDLLADYLHYPTASSITDIAAWGAVSLFIFIFCVVTWLAIRFEFAFGWLWFWLALLPFLHIIPLTILGAERFLYIPTFGVAWVAASLICRFEQRSVRLVISTIIVLFACLTYYRSVIWSNDLTMWSTTHEQAPNNERVHENLVKALITCHDFAKAAIYAESLYEKHPKTKYETLKGFTLCLSGDYDNGLPLVRKNKAHFVLGVIAGKLIQEGKLELAERYLREAAKMAPDNPIYAKRLRSLHHNKSRQ